MSVFIAASRFGSTRRLFCIRALALHAGEDRFGSFTLQKPHQPFFSIYCSNDRYSCTLEDERFSFEGDTGASRSRWLTEKEVISGPDYRFEFFITSPLSEVLARSGGSAEAIAEAISSHAALPRLTVALAGTVKSYSIPQGMDISVGSDPSDSIQIEGQGIAASHISLHNHGGEIQIIPLNGKISVNGESIKSSYLIRSSAEITFNPAGFPLQLSF